MHDDDTPFREPNPTFDRPTLLNGCARAATAAEARFRVQYPNALPRQSRVIALDDGAARMMDGIAEAPWASAHFLRLAPRQPDISPNDVILLLPDGAERLYSAELAGADVVMLIASTSAGQREAAIMGRLAREASVMTAAVVLSGATTDEVVRVLRPAAAVLVIASDPDYLPAMLSALRA